MTEITICSGTLCYIMGGAELYEIEEKLEDIFNEKIKVKASVCLGHCQGDNPVPPPCVEINGELISEATFEKIIEHIQIK